MPSRNIDYALRYFLVFRELKLRIRLERIAKKEKRSLNFIINQACEEFIKS